MSSTLPRELCLRPYADISLDRIGLFPRRQFLRFTPLRDSGMFFLGRFIHQSKLISGKGLSDLPKVFMNKQG